MTTRPPGNRSLTPAHHDRRTSIVVSVGLLLSMRYRLKREIARGGMGIVFEAHDTKLDDLAVAVKVLPPELAGNAKSKARLKKEAITAIGLTHPNIVRLHSFDTDGDIAFLVLELLNGKNLEEATADDEYLPLDEVLFVAGNICPALDFAHRHNVIHRDIKPSNLMYHEAAGERLVKLTDLGIAYVIKDSMTRLTGLEPEGTLLYIAPEQLNGAPPDPRSDQYSLAATLYELLTGNPPFTGRAVTHQILNAKPRPIEGVPEHVSNALSRALSKDPAARFDSCAHLLDAMLNRCPVGPVSIVETPGEAATGEAASRQSRVGEPRPGGDRQDASRTRFPGRYLSVPGARPRFFTVLLMISFLALFLSTRHYLSEPAPVPLTESVPSPSSSDLPPTAPVWPVKVAKATPEPPAGRPGKTRLHTTYTNCLNMRFSRVSPYEFKLLHGLSPSGSYKGMSRHKIQVNEFWISCYETTRSQYSRIFPNVTVQLGEEDLPVVNVSWDDALDFCRRLSDFEHQSGLLPRHLVYSLPTEAQWLVAAGTDLSSSPKPSPPPKLNTTAWISENSNGVVHPVGQLKPNSLNVYDYIGNVWEWTIDFGHDSLLDLPATDQVWLENGDDFTRPIMGGSKDTIPELSVIGVRVLFDHLASTDDIGFRTVIVPAASRNDPRLSPYARAGSSVVKK